MAVLYPSWIEIPVTDLERALTFYRAVFSLEDTPTYEDEPPVRTAVLLASEKEFRRPGVSLVESPQHMPGKGGALINFHLESHAALAAAVESVLSLAGKIVFPLVDMGDGVRYLTIQDSEGNSIALSSYEPLDDQG